MFGVTKKILGRFLNPTANWSPHMRQDLTYDLRSRAINSLKLGGMFEQAEIFGKCNDFEHLNDFLDLFYRQSGFSLGFGDQQLTSVTLIVSQDAYPAKRHKMETCWPRIVDMAGRSHVFSANSTLDDLVHCFGPPVESGPIGNEMAHFFIIGRNFVDAFLHRVTGRLLYLEICGTSDA